MSLSTELTRMAQNVGVLTADTNAIFEALRAKGVSVPANAQLSDVADMIESIVIPHQNEVEIGGRWYPYVQIGNQLWLAENLDYKFPGCVIGQSGSTASESRANYYDNNESTYGVNGNKYGLLYNWTAVNYLEQNKLTLLPPEWRIPTKSDSESLITFVGESSIAGTKLKSTTGWSSGNGDGTYGFNAFPDGSFRDSSFSDLGLTANYWTLTLQEYSTNRAYFIRLNTSPTGTLYNGPTHVQYNIRLVKDLT